MDPKGYVLCKKEFIATKMWPDKQISFNAPYIIDLEAEYKKALAGKVVIVMDISVADDGYLVYAESPVSGPFLWQVEKEDTVNGSFLPLIFKYGVLMPAGLSPMEEFFYLHDSIEKEAAKYRDFHPMYYFKKKKI